MFKNINYLFFRCGILFAMEGVIMTKAIQYYGEAGKLTDLSKHKERLDAIADNPQCICQIVQGLLVHDAWTDAYGFKFRIEDEDWRRNMKMSDLLDKVIELDPRPLTIARMPDNRAVVCCREFAALACAILIAKGIPARSRCGFAGYFANDFLCDHWIVEYWNGKRWIMNDPQIDPLQLSTLPKWGIDVGLNSSLNVHDLTNENFFAAGKVWQLCRKGELDPMKCGIHDLRGLWFVRCQLLRDFAALNKIQLVPHLVRIMRKLDWKSWKLMGLNDNELTDSDLSLLDYIANLTLDVDSNLEKIQKAYSENESLQVPDELLSM